MTSTRASASSSAAARILLSSNWPSACADSEISVTLKREKCALQPGTAAASALVSGSSAVLDEGVSTPRRTEEVMAFPVRGWTAARSLRRARSRIIANFCKTVDISVYTDDDNN